EVRMRRKEGALLGRARALAGEPVDVVVTVALDMREAEQTDERQVLLHGKPSLRGQVLSGQEGSGPRDRVRLRAARRVQQRLVESLATLAGHAAVAAAPRRRERFECRIGFVDQQWQRGI